MNNHGFSPKEWGAAKSEAKELLIARAKLRGMMPYSEIATNIKAVQLQAHDKRLFDLLGELSEEEHAEGRGMISAMVVHKTGDMEPGEGFFELAVKLGSDTSDKTKFWVEELKKIYAYWS